MDHLIFTTVFLFAIWLGSAIVYRIWEFSLEKDVEIEQDDISLRIKYKSSVFPNNVTLFLSHIELIDEKYVPSTFMVILGVIFGFFAYMIIVLAGYISTPQRDIPIILSPLAALIGGVIAFMSTIAKRVVVMGDSGMSRAFTLPDEDVSEVIKLVKNGQRRFWLKKQAKSRGGQKNCMTKPCSLDEVLERDENTSPDDV